MRGIYTTKEMIRRKQILEKLRQASVQQDVLPNELDDVEAEDEDEGAATEQTEETMKLETIPSMPSEDEDFIDAFDSVSDFNTERTVRQNLFRLREMKKLKEEVKLDEDAQRRKDFEKSEERREQGLLQELTNLRPGPFEHENIEELTKRQVQAETAVTRKATIPKLHGIPEVHQFASEKNKEEFLQTMDEVVESLPEDDGLTDEERTEFYTAIIQMNPALARLSTVLQTRNYPEKKHQQLLLAFVQTYDDQQPRKSPIQQVPKIENPAFGVRDITLSEEEFFLPSELLLRSQIIAGGGTLSDKKPPVLCSFCEYGNHYFDALNVPLLTQFMTKSGRVIPRKYTGLCGNHQRKISKTIRIARNMGIFSYKKGNFQIHSPFSTM